MRSRRSQSQDGDLPVDDLLPLAEVFGGAFALLITLFLIIHNLAGVASPRMLPPRSDAGPAQISWLSQGGGWTVIVRPDKVRIVQDGSEAMQGQICTPKSPYREFIKQRYREQKNVVLVVLDGGVDVALEARNCIWDVVGERSQIGWIVADTELLKSLSVDQIPPEVQTVTNYLRARRE